jgi:hypothetical protein
MRVRVYQQTTVSRQRAALRNPGFVMTIEHVKASRCACISALAVQLTPEIGHSRRSPRDEP